MKKIILVLMLLSTIPIFSQNHYIGIKSGVNLTNARSDQFFIENSERIGFKGGLTYQYLINNSFSIGIDLLYDQRGFKNNTLFINQYGDPVGPNKESDFNYDYLSLPIKAGYSIGNTFSGFINLGIVPALIVNTEIIVPTFEGSKTYNIKENIKSFDFAGVVEAGATYSASKRVLLITTFAYQHSATITSNPIYLYNNKMRHYGMTLSFGVKYALKKE